MITKAQYVEFLISTPVNYTCTHLSDHLKGVSHDSISDFLKKQRYTSQSVWTLASKLIRDGEETYLICDDSVQEKPHARAIELVSWHYSGNKHRVVQGIDIVNLVHSSGDGEFFPIDYRIYAPDHSNKTKNDHFLEMLEDAFEHKKVRSKYVLFDSWYASADNLKYIHRKQKIFYTELKSNRLVSLGPDLPYIHLEEIEWTEERLDTGVMVKLKEVPFHVRLFKVVATNGDIVWLITNDPTPQLTRDDACDHYDVRWNVECFHRDLKQLTGIEKCQSRTQWAQRNHIACCYHAWITLKVRASTLGQSLYHLRQELFSDYLTNELKNPRIPAFSPSSC
jgi:hypothetical protein